MGLLSSIGTIAGNALAPGWGGIAGNLIGGALEGGAQTTGGMQQSAAAQQAAQQAATASQFRPVGITNTFGTSGFQFDPSGNLVAAGYALSPQLQGLQTDVMGGLRTSLGDTQRLQQLGRGYLAQNPQEVAANWLQQQQALLKPAQEQQLSNIQNKLFQQGRSGLSVAQGGDLAASNPELQAYYNALAQQNASLAAQAQQQGQQQVQFGQGLLTGAYQPFTAGLSTAGSIEGLGQQPFDLSTALGAKTSTAGANAAKYIATPAYAYSSGGTLLSALGKGLSGYTGNLGGLFGGSSIPTAANNNAFDYLNTQGQLPSLDYSNFVWG